ERWMISSFTASSLIHLSLIPLAGLLIHAKPLKPVNMPVELIELPRVEQPKKVEVVPPPPPLPPVPKPKLQNVTGPKLLSKPVLDASPLPPTGNTKEPVKETPIAEPLAALPDNANAAKAGWNAGTPATQAEGSTAGAGNLFGKGDVGIVGGSGVAGGGGGTGASGLGRGAAGDGTGGGAGSGEALSGMAKPLGGYQVKPRYPESAKRIGAQGVTTLRVRVLETGRVSEVLVEQTAGFRDLDIAATEAVKKWLFEPARRGKEAVSVWVLLPVKFELH
ncbi:MAG TPA: energy transducer TonB, partial [Candidatus Limnocylindrales bacterium]|nr:energy transducer TonB [Candidatus Limnocylindrales bacterium]